MQRLVVAINTLDGISVSGRQNRNALNGSISLLEGIADYLQTAEITGPDDKPLESEAV